LLVPPASDDGAGKDLEEKKAAGEIPSEIDVKNLLGKLKSAQVQIITTRIKEQYPSNEELREEIKSNPGAFINEERVLQMAKNGIGGKKRSIALKLDQLMVDVFNDFSK